MRYYLLTRSWRLEFLSAVIKSVASRAACCLPRSLGGAIYFLIIILVRRFDGLDCSMRTRGSDGFG